MTLCAARAANAGPWPGGWNMRGGVNFGASAAWASSDDLGDVMTVGFDVTGFVPIRRPLFFWFSACGRVFGGAEGVSGIPCVETGISIPFITLGTGAGVGFGNDVPRWSWHMMLAMPIPLWVPYKGHLFYVQPYYRPAFDITGEERPTIHEVGVFFKWLVAFLKL